MPKSQAARTFGVSRSSVKRYAAARREGRPLAPRKHPGSKPKLDQRARKILQSDRSEEHTSELQSRQYLVCRLLLEKKNQNDGSSLYPLTALPIFAIICV